MKQLNKEDLKKLKYGDKVYKFFRGRFKRYYFVAVMPKSDKTLIFCDGSDITTVYLSDKMGLSSKWFSGDWNDEFVGNHLIEYYEKQIRGVRGIFLEDSNENF